jgi:hypothetical protein
VKIGATKIAELVVASMFPIPRHMCVANVAWSLLPYEADLIAVTQAGYMIEVEIKISLSDLKREDAKAKWRSRSFGELVSRFYYAMPGELWDKPAAQAAIRPGAGVIVIREVGNVLRVEMVREAERTSARALTQREQFDLARVGSYRAWSPFQRHRQRQLRAEHALEDKKRAHRWQEYLKSKETA